MGRDDLLRLLGALMVLYGVGLLAAMLFAVRNSLTHTTLLPGVKLLAALSVISGGVATARRDRWALLLLLPGVLLLPVHALEASRSMQYGFTPYMSVAALLYLGAVLAGIYHLRSHLR